MSARVYLALLLAAGTAIGDIRRSVSRRMVVRVHHSPSAALFWSCDNTRSSLASGTRSSRFSIGSSSSRKSKPA